MEEDKKPFKFSLSESQKSMLTVVLAAILGFWASNLIVRSAIGHHEDECLHKTEIKGVFQGKDGKLYRLVKSDLEASSLKER